MPWINYVYMPLVGVALIFFFGWMIRRSDKKTFERGLALLGARETAISGLTVLEKLVKVDKESYGRVMETIVGYLHTNYALTEKQGIPDASDRGQEAEAQDALQEHSVVEGRESSQKSEILQVALDLIGRVNGSRPVDKRQRVRLGGLDLQGRHLSGDWRLADLGRANLMGANLRQANLAGANLRRANLKGANLCEAILIDVNFREAKLEGADFRGANLMRAYLWEANLNGADLLGTYLGSAELWQAQLKGAHLLRANLEGAHLLRANLQEADLRGASLESVDLQEGQLEGADLRGVNLTSMDLTQASLAGAMLSCNESEAQEYNLLIASSLNTLDVLARRDRSLKDSGQKYPNLFFEDKEAETLWPKGAPESIKNLKGISQEDLPPHWRYLEI